MIVPLIRPGPCRENVPLIDAGDLRVIPDGGPANESVP